MPRSIRRRRIAIALALLSFAPYGLAHWHANRYNWTPLDYRTDLGKGVVRTPDFVIDADGRYVLYIQVEPRKIELQRKECLLGLEWLHPENCSTVPSVIDLTWTLSNSGRVVQDQSSLQTWRAGSYSYDYTRREIGRFDGHGGKRYAIEMMFRADPSPLNAANPRIVAEALKDWEAHAIELQFSFLLGILLVAIAIILFVVPSGLRLAP